MNPQGGDRILLALSDAETEERGGWLVYEAERHCFHLEDPLGATHAIFSEGRVLTLQRRGFLRPGSRGWELAPPGRERLRAMRAREPRRRSIRGRRLSEMVLRTRAGNDCA